MFINSHLQPCKPLPSNGIWQKLKLHLAKTACRLQTSPLPPHIYKSTPTFPSHKFIHQLILSTHLFSFVFLKNQSLFLSLVRSNSLQPSLLWWVYHQSLHVAFVCNSADHLSSLFCWCSPLFVAGMWWHLYLAVIDQAAVGHLPSLSFASPSLDISCAGDYSAQVRNISPRCPVYYFWHLRQYMLQAIYKHVTCVPRSEVLDN
jgi:hypothetical protein